MDKKAVGNRIKEIRKKHGYTQLEMSEVLEMSYDAYKKLERGVSKIPVDKLILLSQKFNISVTHILFGEKSDYELTIEQVNLLEDSDKMSLLIRLISYFTNMKNKSLITSDKSLDREIDEFIEVLKNKGII